MQVRYSVGKIAAVCSLCLLAGLALNLLADGSSSPEELFIRHTFYQIEESVVPIFGATGKCSDSYLGYFKDRGLIDYELIAITDRVEPFDSGIYGFARIHRLRDDVDLSSLVLGLRTSKCSPGYSLVYSLTDERLGASITSDLELAEQHQPGGTPLLSLNRDGKIALNVFLEPEDTSFEKVAPNFENLFGSKD